MRFWSLRLLPFLITSLILIVFSLIYPRYLLATSGCCSWHGGQSYCDYSTGRWVCNDGTYSPTCTCGSGGIVLPTPRPVCPLYSSFNSFTDQCECYSGYIASGSQCISQTQACQNDLGFSSRYNSLTGNCECSYGYVISGGKCTYGNTFCTNKYGFNSTYDIINNNCKCNYGYGFNSSGTRCISDDEACQEQFGYNSKANIIGDKCECKSGYVWQGNSCVWDTSEYTNFTTVATVEPTVKPTPTDAPTPNITSTPKPTVTPKVQGISTELTPIPTPTITPLTTTETGITLGVLATIIGLPTWIIIKIIRRFRRPKIEI